jgi:hypothetical protein
LLQQREVLTQIVQETIVQQDVIRKEYEDQLAVFEGHDLEKIASSKHEKWLGKLATDATTKYFKGLENVFNDN